MWPISDYLPINQCTPTPGQRGAKCDGNEGVTPHNPELKQLSSKQQPHCWEVGIQGRGHQIRKIIRKKKEKFTLYKVYSKSIKIEAKFTKAKMNKTLIFFKISLPSIQHPYFSGDTCAVTVELFSLRTTNSQEGRFWHTPLKNWPCILCLLCCSQIIQILKHFFKFKALISISF